MKYVKKRPLCGICLLLILLIWLCRAAGLPCPGEPRLPAQWNQSIEEGMTVRLTGTVASRQKKARSTQYILKSTSIFYGNQQVSVRKILLTSREKQPLSIGSRVSVTGKLSRPEEPGNPGQFDSRSYDAGQGIFLVLQEYDRRVLSAGSGWREKLAENREGAKERMTSLMSPGSASILTAMLLGDRSVLDEDTRLDFQMSGVIHLLCISGLHISLLGVSAFRLCLLLLFWMRPRRARWIAAPVSFLLILLYGIYTGGTISTMRAVLMFAVYLGAILLKRSYDSLSALSLAAILLLLQNPAVLFQAGFLLSFSAVLGSCVLPPLLSAGFLSLRQPPPRKELRAPGRVLLWLQRQILSWLSVTLVILPLSAWFFYEIPVFSLPVNLLLLPFMTILLEAGIVGILAGILWPAAGLLILFPVDLCLRFYSAVTGFVRRLPDASLICGQPSVLQLVLYYLVLFFLCIHLYRQKIYQQKKAVPTPAGRKQHPSPHSSPRARALTICLLFLLFPILFFRPQQPFTLTMLDVGQGDALVLHQGYGAVFLCDGGSSSVTSVGKYRLLPYLKQQGIRRVDCVFISHGDEDHIGGIEELLEDVAERKTTLHIDRIAMPPWMKTDARGRKLCRLAENAGAKVIWTGKGSRMTSSSSVFRKNDLHIAVLHPFSESRGMQEGNAGSMVLSVTYGNFSALLTGDLEREGESELLPFLSHCDYLKVAHHGSRYSTSARFLAEVSPSVCAISAPEHSRYGHPHQETLERIRQEGADIFITRDCGAITAVTNGRTWSIQTCKHPSGEDAA